jgi:hypothetical protein
MSVFSKWVKLALVLVPVVVVLAVAIGGALASEDCEKVNGQVVIQVVNDPACASPVGLCAVTDFSGDVEGQSSFTATSVLTTRDTPSTSVILITGDNVIRTQRGTLTTKDAIVNKSTGNGEFAEVDVVVAGTGRWHGATGTLTATGTFLNGFGEGDYEGEICMS